MNKIISIVTPSFNQGKFIEETIQSILRQEGEFFIDYIIIDGASTDNTLEVIKKYETLLQENCSLDEETKFFIKENKNFDFNKCMGVQYRWISEKDNGQVDALKKGFKIAKGQIFCWLNSDDIYVDDTVFNRVIKYFDADLNLKLITADGPFITEDNKQIAVHHVDQINYKELLFLDYHILQPSTFFHKDIYNEKNMKEKYVCAFDADFFIHMISDQVPYKKTDDLFGAFRYYPEIKTLSLNRKRFREQNCIAFTYSKNIYFLFVSIIYRYVQIILSPKYKGNKRFDSIFRKVKRMSYKIITGKPER